MAYLFFQIIFICRILIILWDHEVCVHVWVCVGMWYPWAALVTNLTQNLDPDPALSSGQPAHAALHPR